MLDYSHNAWLVAASLAVAMMAGFTGLYLTHGASKLGDQRRKFIVALAAIILGGGIGWAIDSARGADNKYDSPINITLAPDQTHSLRRDAPG